VVDGAGRFGVLVFDDFYVESELEDSGDFRAIEGVVDVVLDSGSYGVISFHVWMGMIRWAAV